VNVEVVAIENTLDAGILEVRLRVGQQESSVRFATGMIQIEEQAIQTLDYEQGFWDAFKFNQHIVFRVMGLVRSVLAGETVALPIVVGRLHTAEELQAERSSNLVAGETMDDQPLSI
jgi:hypothetical protein